MSQKFVLEDHKKKIAERGVDIEAGGQTFHLDPPELWPDDVAATQSSDLRALGVAILGEERFDAFVAAGGSGGLLASIVEEAFHKS